jgi:hypothetical protein
VFGGDILWHLQKFLQNIKHGEFHGEFSELSLEQGVGLLYFPDSWWCQAEWSLWVIHKA